MKGSMKGEAQKGNAGRQTGATSMKIRRRDKLRGRVASSLNLKKADKRYPAK